MVFPNFPTIRNRFILFGAVATVIAFVKGLIQWLSGEYYVDGDGYPVDGRILDKSAQQGGYPNIASGYALSFDGVSDYAEINSEFTYLGEQDFTVSFWIYLVDQGATPYASNQVILNQQGSTINSISISTDLDLRIRLGNINYTSLGFFTGETDKWTHVSIVAKRTSNAEFYKNGVLFDTSNISSGQVTIGFYYIGARPALDNNLNGSIASLLINFGALTDVQVQELYNGDIRPTGLSAADIDLDLRLIEGAGVLVKDYSPSANDVTGTGTTWLANIPYGQQMAFAGHNVALNGGNYINVAGVTDDATTDINSNPIIDFVYDINRYKLPTTAVQVFDGMDDDVSLGSEITYAANFELKFVFAPNSFATRELVSGSGGEYIRLNSASQISINTAAGVSNFAVTLIEKGINEVLIQRFGSSILCTVNGQLQDSVTNSGTFKINNIGSDTFDGYIKSVEDVGNHLWTEANGWIDEVGSNDGTVNGSPTSEIVALTYANHATPKTGIALDFDGVNDKVEIISDVFSNVANTDISIAFWYKRVTSAATFILDPRNSGSSDGFNISQTAVNNIQFQGANILTTDLLNGNWQYISISFTIGGTSVTAYVNGVSQGSIGAGTILRPSQGKMKLMTSFVNTSFNDGDIASFQVYKSLLTPTQITELYRNPQLDCPSDLDRSNLALSLRLDDAIGATALDYSGNANNGTITGATWIYGQEFPVKQLCLSNFNISGSNELIFGVTDDALVDINGDPLTPRKASELALPYIYHEGLVTPHNDSMNPTDGYTFGFVTEYALVNTFDVIVSKGDDITAVNSIGVRAIGGDFQLVVNTATINLAYASALTGIHSHFITVGIAGNYVWYIDGVSRASGTTNAAPTNTDDLYQFSDLTDGREFTKNVGDFQFYNKVLTAAEALNNFNAIKTVYGL